mmetsp:Transcript_54297/g.151120  ORF Transcript_54297/g.151120 Transcript_54297/m.151120 type:complete len:514 (-) Transcript_54297:17-1558(-)
MGALEACRCSHEPCNERKMGVHSACRSVSGESLWVTIYGRSWDVFLVVALGVSAHATKHAIAPAQPAMEDAGLSPVLYAAIAASPLVGSILLPVFWGVAYERYKARALTTVPSGEFLGQLAITSGIGLLGLGSIAATQAKVLLVVGLTVFSCFHGGVAVVQHTALAHVLPNRCLTSGYMTIVIGTHLTAAACNAIAPRILRFGGLLALQVTLLGPSLLLSIPAGYLLARRARTGGVGPGGEHGPVAITRPRSSGALVLPLLDSCACGLEGVSSCTCDEAERRPVRSECVVLLLGLWRALLQGLGHAFQSVLNGLLVSYGLSPEAAGVRLATSQAAALLMLPCVAIAADMWGRRCLLVLTSWMALAAGAALAWGASMPGLCLDMALFAWSLAEVLAPVLSLSLIPANARSSTSAHGGPSTVGCSFGVAECLSSLAQVSFLLLIGILREAGGFTYVFRLLCTGLTAACCLSAALVPVLRDHAAQGFEAKRIRDPLPRSIFRFLVSPSGYIQAQAS